MNPKGALLAPSILSADFSRLGEELREVEAAGADWLHVDVMDGHFVPNLTVGPLVVQALKPWTRLPLDCHLMVSRPEDWIDAFVQAGADIITVHAEATVHLDRLLNRIRESGCRAGVSVNPGTSLAAIEEILDLVDLVLVMSVNPGFGGQKFIESALSKIERLAELRSSLTRQDGFLIEVDGGVNAENLGRLRRAGADVFVAGNAVFGTDDRRKAMAALRKALQ
ncbi:MAG: ribulose-phosphate 3-epimerase [Oligoflexia bacterium]|nr:ribulose-phosphate 3-epimerase [Oligoflexia bacterium]